MIIHNPILTGSFTVNGTDVSSITSSAASLTSLNAYTASQNNRNGTYATTGSNTFAGIQTVNSNLVVTGSITAQTLVVQTVTSSVVYSSGSNVFGNNIANTQVFTGSMNLTGSLIVVTTGTEFQVNANGVKFGNVIGDAHSITGSVGISGSLSGSSANFSGTVTVASPFTIKALNPYIQWQNAAGTRLGYIQHATDLVMSADTGSIILNNPSGNALTIISTGAASFLNSVNINSASGISGAQGFLFFNNSGTNASSRNWKISNDQIDWGDFIIQYSSTQTGATSNTALAITSGGNITVPNLLTPNRLSLSTYTSLYGKKVVKADAVSSFTFNLSTMFPEMSSTFSSNVVGCFGVYTIFRGGSAETGTFSLSRNGGGSWSTSAFSVQTATGAYSLSNVTGSGTSITMTFNTAVYVIVEVTAMIE
jgi:hypothetical protein